MRLITKKVILRSISISKDDAISEDVRYSKNELKTIASKFWGKKAQKTADTTINLSDVDSKTLHVDIKTSNIKLEDNRELGDCVLSQNTVKVKPLQLGKNAAGGR
ncbi:hypothetical protein RHORCCE3_2036 [Rickettsia hoogstraalii str. RCCE3]|nr:hypothetical protein RHORCCE3_2036 [Rickettsia hoogstraalii str. RCCE3]